MSRLDAALRRAATPPRALRALRARHESDQPADGPQTLARVDPPGAGAAATPATTQPGLMPEPMSPANFRAPELNSDDPRFSGFHESDAEKLVTSPTMPQPMREHYRRLSATLHHAQAESGIKLLMISSAVPDEGKTLTATNIALTFSESYHQRVLLIDADLRRPSLGALFQMPKIFGLNEALTSVPERRVPLIQVSRHLSLLTAGAPDSDPMSTLTSKRMKRLLDEAAATFDWVVIDTPPVGILTDAKLLGSMVDAALLVIRSGKTPAQLVQRAVDALGRERILGVVLNRTAPRNAAQPYGYYNTYYYGTKKP